MKPQEAPFLDSPPYNNHQSHLAWLEEEWVSLKEEALSLSELEPTIQIKIGLDSSTSTEEEMLEITLEKTLKLCWRPDSTCAANKNKRVKVRVNVPNWTFEKNVKIVFTKNDWKSVHFDHLKWIKSLESRSTSLDQFECLLDLDAISTIDEDVNQTTTCDETIHLQFAIQYSYGGSTTNSLWANNNGLNYSVLIYPVQRMRVKRTKSKMRLHKSTPDLKQKLDLPSPDQYFSIPTISFAPAAASSASLKKWMGSFF